MSNMTPDTDITAAAQQAIQETEGIAPAQLSLADILAKMAQMEADARAQAETIGRLQTEKDNEAKGRKQAEETVAVERAAKDAALKARTRGTQPNDVFDKLGLQGMIDALRGKPVVFQAVIPGGMEIEHKADDGTVTIEKKDLVFWTSTPEPFADRAQEKGMAGTRPSAVQNGYGYLEVPGFGTVPLRMRVVAEVYRK